MVFLTSFTTPEINIDTIEGENHSIINQMVDEISKKIMNMKILILLTE